MGTLLNKAVDCFDKFTSHDEAFGMPPGTVRGVVFIALTFTICWMAVNGKEVPVAVIASWSGMIGFYFGQKHANGQPPQNQTQPAT